MLRADSRRPRTATPIPDLILPEPTSVSNVPPWLEPYPDVLLDNLVDQAPGPETRYETTEAISLAFITALQLLPPRQRAVLVLRDVLGYRAAEVADLLDTSEDSVTSALKRARATVPGGPAPSLPDSAKERDVVARFADAIEEGDVDAMVALLTDDVWLTMPPAPVEYQGRAAFATFMTVVGYRGGSRRQRLVPTAGANGQPAFGCYVTDLGETVWSAHGLMVLTLRDARISMVTRFVDNSLMEYFGLPEKLT
jgi:RNA polymerase sigma-70 factor (ECF subfamily)